MRSHRLLLYFLWILSIVCISFYGGTISYGFFFAVTLIPVISGVYLLCVFFHYRIYQKVEGRTIVSDQPVPYYFILQNEAFFAFSGIRVGMHETLSYLEELPQNQEYELLPGQRYKYETRLVCRYRGEYPVGIKEVIVTDFFRLFRIRYAIKECIQAIVLPKVVEVESLRSVGDIHVQAARESYSRRVEPDITVRDYVQGDSLKQIHWKSSARFQQLKTREKIDEEKRGVALFFDTQRISDKELFYLPSENKILELVLAIGLFWANRGITFRTYYGCETPKSCVVSGIPAFDSFYEEIKKVSFLPTETMEQGIQQALLNRSLVDSRVVFLILHKLTQTVLLQAHKLRTQGCNVVIYIVGNEEEKTVFADLAKGIYVQFISVEADLKEVLP